MKRVAALNWACSRRAAAANESLFSYITSLAALVDDEFTATVGLISQSFPTAGISDSLQRDSGFVGIHQTHQWAIVQNRALQAVTYMDRRQFWNLPQSLRR